MNTSLVSLTAFALVLSAAVVVPMPASAFVSSTPMSGLFLGKDATGTVALAFTPPLNQEGAFVSAGVAKSPQDPVPAVLCARVPVEQAPAPLCGSKVLGSVVAHASFQIAGDGGLQLWLSTNAPRLLVRDVIVRLEHVNATGVASTVYRFDYGSSASNAMGTVIAPREQEGLANAVPWLDGTARRIAMGDNRAAVFNVTEGDTLRLVLDAIMTPVTVTDQAQVRVHYGAAMPSGAVFPVIGQDAWRVQLGTEALALRLRDDNVTFYPLDNETDQIRQFQADKINGVVQPSMPEASRLRWGPTPLDEGTRIVGAGLAEIWLQTAATTGANPQLAVDVTLTIGKNEFVGVTNTAINLAQSASLTKLVIPIQTKQIDLVAGENVTIDVELFGVNATKFSVVYGSVNHTSGIVLPVLGGGLVRPIVYEDPLPFIGDEESPTPSDDGPVDPEPDAPPTGDEEAPPADDGGSDSGGATEEVTLKEAEPKGRSPGPGLALLVVLVVGAALVRRRAGR